MIKIILLVVFSAACASVAFTQSPDYQKFEIYGGYSHNHETKGHEGFDGFNASLTRNISPYVGLKFDVAGHFGKQAFFEFLGNRAYVTASVFNFLGGVQIKNNSTDSRFKPFGHALIGIAHARNKISLPTRDLGFLDELLDFCSPDPGIQNCPSGGTDTGFAGGFGGGLDIRINRRFDLRAIQADYNPTWLFGSRQQNFRLGAGIVIHK